MYMSPEELKGIGTFDKSDIYSFGISLFELWYGPFITGMERLLMLEKVKKKNIVPEDIAAKMDSKAVKLINECLIANHELRKSARELFESELIPERIEEKKFN